MDLQNMQGIVTIVLTPFTEQGKIDENGLKSLIWAAVDKGLNGVVVLGSNSEFPYLKFEEKLQVMGVAAEAAAKKIPVIGTASAFSTELAVELAQEAKKAGCDAVMAALPLYFDLDLESAIKHYRTLAEQGGLPIYYYHFPNVTGFSISPKDISRIAEIDEVIGSKITVVNKPFLKKTIKATKSFNWKVFTGTSLLLNDCLELDGAGVFCPMTLIGHRSIKSIWDAFNSGNRLRARSLQNDLLRSIPLFTGAKTSPVLLAKGFKAMVSLPFPVMGRPFAFHGLLKEALRLQGYPITNKVRRPYFEVDSEQQRMVEKTLKDLGWL